MASPQVRITSARSAVTAWLSTVSCIRQARGRGGRALCWLWADLVWKNACISNP
ncbi:hypothetical protein [Rugamonas rivuli]|uniref:hypothetical protein n=1 Tax=Rugamonas rivuli TaxID=2743358 RepID=UPI001F484A95|nr:hypothetical protein [Rugamonas rivuli]